MSQENQGYTVAPPSKGSKIMNIIAPIVLIGCFIGGVGYASIALMGNRNDNYHEKVEQMKKEKEAQKAKAEVVSEVLVK
jgi:hypothetical protein